MSEFDAPTRRDYLQFITGSPKLPIGGTSTISCHIAFTVNRSDPEYKASVG